jgi:hypothetical protein
MLDWGTNKNREKCAAGGTNASGHGKWSVHAALAVVSQRALGLDELAFGRAVEHLKVWFTNTENSHIALDLASIDGRRGRVFMG